jgi:thiamine biosynthesis lipoprotein
MFNEKSVISRINQEQTNYIDDSEEGRMFLEVYNLAMKISNETDGAFDITVAPLVNAWGFGFKENVFPDNQTIDSLLQIVGYQKQSFFEDKKGKGIRKNNKRMMFDCSAIAKGYGTDVVARLLEKYGVENYMVEIGGEVVTRGINPKRVPWKIGVNKPIEDSLSKGEIQTVLNVTDRAMATSGNYRNFYYRGGQKYAHTIDPRTGHPVQHSLLSATVLTDNCATADAYATAFMVMGLDRAKQFLEKHPELLVYFIYAKPDGNTDTWFSPSLKDNFCE